jgi:hypothetical protein
MRTLVGDVKGLIRLLSRLVQNQHRSTRDDDCGEDRGQEHAHRSSPAPDNALK